MSEIIGGFITLILALALLCGACWSLHSMGHHEGTQAARLEAVEHGCAEFVMDPATGRSTWRWKP